MTEGKVFKEITISEAEQLGEGLEGTYIGWLCIKCERINSPYVSFCSCQDKVAFKAKYEGRNFFK